MSVNRGFYHAAEEKITILGNWKHSPSRMPSINHKITRYSVVVGDNGA